MSEEADEVPPPFPQHELLDVLRLHNIWQRTNHADGVRANLAGTNLENADLRNKNLGEANLAGAWLEDADLIDAFLNYADLSDAWLQDANLLRAHLRVANLSKAFLGSAILSGVDLQAANLTGAELNQAKLDNANLLFVRGLRLNNTYIRGAQFSPVASRWWAFLTTQIFPRLVPRLQRWRWKWPWQKLLHYREHHNDPWSVLRQLYSGPRTLFLFFFVIVFTLPYAGRAAFYSTVSHAEQRLIEGWRRHKENWPEAHAKAAQAGERVGLGFDDPETWLRSRTRPRPLWQVVLRWDEGRIGPSILAIALILYNVGVYWLITSIGPLRDEEERSGWSPAWKDYGYLRWIHRAVTLLFYLSFGTFLWNLLVLLNETVWVPSAAG